MIPFILECRRHEPVTYEYRHKEQPWTTPTDFLPQTNTPTAFKLTESQKHRRFILRATDAEGTVVYNNGPYLTLNNPVVTITELPADQYEVGQDLPALLKYLELPVLVGGGELLKMQEMSGLLMWSLYRKSGVLQFQQG